MPFRNGTNVKPYAMPLLAAFSQMQSWLEHDLAPCVVVAAYTRQELDCRELPTHIEVSAVKPLRRRMAARVSRGVMTDEFYQALPVPHFACVLNGCAVLKFTDYALQCRAADCIFMPPGILRPLGSHIPEQFKEAQCDILWLRPDETGDGLNAWICHSEFHVHDSGPEQGTCRVDSPLLRRQFQNLSEELQGENDGKLVRGFLLGLLGVLRREIEQGRACLPGHHVADYHQPLGGNPHDLMEEVCIFIDEHLEQPLTAERIARRFYLSKTAFHRRFHAHAGDSFHNFLTARRLQKASALLLETDIPVADISRLVGLEYSQLRRLYYRCHGCSPGEFRKNKM